MHVVLVLSSDFKLFVVGVYPLNPLRLNEFKEGVTAHDDLYLVYSQLLV